MRIFGDAAAARGEHAHPDLHFSAYAAGTPQLAWIAESSLVERALETALRFAHTVQTFPHAATGFEMEADAVRLTPFGRFLLLQLTRVMSGKRLAQQQDRLTFLLPVILISTFLPYNPTRRQ